MLEKIKNIFRTKTWSEQTIAELEKESKTERTTLKMMIIFTFGIWIGFRVLDLINLIPMTEMNWIMVLLLLITSILQLNIIQDVDTELRFKKIEEKIQP